MNTLKNIIFDLDDTLLDTWNQLVQPARSESAHAMIQNGLPVSHQECLEKMDEIHEKNPRASIFKVLSEIYIKNPEERKKVESAGEQAFLNRKVRPPLRLKEGAEELLKNLKKKYNIFLVTTGHPGTQKQKVQLLKIGNYFDKIFYVNSLKKQTKFTAFQQILGNSAHSPSQFLCVGDRLNNEIYWANLLGIKTCHIKYGEYKKLFPKQFFEKPDFTIYDINKLIPLINRNWKT